MNKAVALLTIIAALASTPVFATHIGGVIESGASTTPTQKGGFVNPNGAVTTVKQVQDMADKTWVTMRGNIEKRVGDDDYLFRDASGVMRVEIDRKRWEGQTVTPTDNVEIQGKVDKNYNSVELDVKQIRKIQD